MNITLLKEHTDAAREKWREYKDAFKTTKDPMYKSMREVYNAIKNGHAIVNVFDAIKQAGLRKDTGHPLLAIGPASSKKILVRQYADGGVFYSTEREWPRGWNGRRALGNERYFDKCLPPVQRDFNLVAPIPIIPPRLRPAKLTADYFILWEVDHWTPVPSKDPYLLKHVTGDLYTVCAGWDLTDIELSIMKGFIK